jgi:hypothetical protein
MGLLARWTSGSATQWLGQGMFHDPHLPNPWSGEKVERLGWQCLWMPNPHHGLDPRSTLWRVRHWLTGPQRGCSCTRCFNHPRRRVPATEFYRDRIRLAAAERRVQELEQRERALEDAVVKYINAANKTFHKLALRARHE